MKKLILCCLFFSSQAFSAPAIDVLQGKLQAMKRLKADFNQVVKTQNREISNSSGTMALERPGRFRWETKKPMEQLVVADGKKIWIYDVDLEQVSVKAQDKDLGGTAALFLSGRDDNTLARDFTVKESISGNVETFSLKATSNKANFQKIILVFQDNTLNSLEMFDQLGQHTIVSLSNIQENTSIAPELFQFKAPEGTDVVQQ